MHSQQGKTDCTGRGFVSTWYGVLCGVGEGFVWIWCRFPLGLHGFGVAGFVWVCMVCCGFV